jgi:uncharacterized protein YggU (UPF0235/DUF167 family)
MVGAGAAVGTDVGDELDDVSVGVEPHAHSVAIMGRHTETRRLRIRIAASSTHVRSADQSV